MDNAEITCFHSPLAALSAIARSTSVFKSRFFTPTFTLLIWCTLTIWQMLADVGTCQTLQLLHLFCGIIAIIAHEVSPAKFFKMFLGIIGTTILTFGGYLMTVGVCPKC